MPLLQTHALHKWFGGLHVTDDVHFTLEKGELHCLVGSNGAGKSTFFHLLLGTLAPSGGVIRFDGRDMTRQPAYQRVRSGMSVKFQVPGIFQDMAVRQNIRVALQRRIHAPRVLAQQTDQMLEFLHLHPQATQLAGNLSHGQKQWLEIGMALSLAPTLLLLDEPTAGMTPEETAATGQMILDLNRQGLTVLFVEQNLEMIQAMAQRCHVMDKGQMTEELTPDQLSDPQVMRRCLSI